MTNMDYVEVNAPKQSGFDLSYSNKLTMDFGDIVPVLKQEILPGDEFKVKSQFMVRFAPMSNPIYTKINAQIHYFFVPNRILWNASKKDGWETFITGGPDGTATPTPPYFTITTDEVRSALFGNVDAGASNGVQTLGDYLGLPLKQESNGYYTGHINALPFLAYQKIYADWFRDPNVTVDLFDKYEDIWTTGGDKTSKPLSTTDEKEAFKSMVILRKRCWNKDYFTSALPWAQRGPEVYIPTSSTVLDGYLTSETGAVLGDEINGSVSLELSDDFNFLGTIRDLRNANALQRWLERNAIGGGRYIEQLLSHFGVYSDDARLQRAQYLGSVSAPVVISEVQSNASTEDAPVGYLAGKGVAYGNDFAFGEKFKEHGWLIGVMTIMPEASYAQGLHRSFSHRNDKLDYAFPEFCEIGLQEIDNSELYVYGNIGGSTFGYNDRYGEYKSNYNEVHGYFKDSESPMAQYNMTRFYDDTPELSNAFLQVREQDITSPFIDQTKNSGNLWVDIWNDIKAVRSLTKNSVPLM